MMVSESATQPANSIFFTGLAGHKLINIIFRQSSDLIVLCLPALSLLSL